MRFLTLLLCMTPLLLPAADLSREQRVAEQIEKNLQSGSAVRLKAGDLEVFAIHQEADADAAQGGVILLHGLDGHPDQAAVIQPLRTGLPRHGWETLSIQLPLAGPGSAPEDYVALLPEASARIEAALAHFKSRKIEHLVLAGYDLGARAAVEFLGAKTPPQRKAVKGLVMIGLGLDKQNEKSIAALKKIKLPVLDIHAARDTDVVLSSRQLHRQMARYAGNKKYRQSEIVGADHFFQGSGAMLVLRIRGWLVKNLPNPKPLYYKDLKK